MARRMPNIRITHIDASGKVFTDEQFMRGEFKVYAEDNVELLRQAALYFDPNYAAHERAKERYERTSKRLEKLKAEEVRVRAELAAIEAEQLRAEEEAREQGADAGVSPESANREGTTPEGAKSEERRP